MTVDLRFGPPYTPSAGGSVPLRFGQASGSGATVQVSVNRVVHAAWVQGAVQRRLAITPWQSPRLAGRQVRAGYAAGRASTAETQSPWLTSAPLAPNIVRALFAAPHGVPPVEVLSAWRGGFGITAPSVLSRFQKASALALAQVSAWHPASARAQAQRYPWQPGRLWARRTEGSWHGGRLGGLDDRSSWRGARALSSRGNTWSPVFVVPPVFQPCYLPDPGGAVRLRFSEVLLQLTNLIFACRVAAVALVPVRRVYMVTNVTTLVRVSDGTAIPCLGFTLSVDVDSWAWGFSASLPADALTLVEPGGVGEPIELAATVNGTEFRVIAESLGRERAFGQASVRVQGRGKTAVLDAPYSAVSVFSAAEARTSQQLLDAALPTGWSAAWGLTAWAVPGGTWSHQGTPISAALAVAAAGGGYLLPHASASSFSVKPRYPTAPWAWGSLTPDLELPASVTTRESIDWVELPRYNRVFVSGSTAGGKLVRVTRTGTAGDLAAPMVTDALITHADAGRQRGLPVLARTGRWADVTLRLPVLSETGVIRPGTFVRYTDGLTARLGLVRSVGVDVGRPEVWQSIKVETYVN